MPTGRGGNLTQPLKKVLINVPSPDNLGAYLDTTTNFRVLQFLQHGYSIPANGNQTVVVTQPQAPVPKVALVSLNTVAPVDPTNYNYGVTVLKHVRKPGVDNSDYFPHQKFYGGELPVVTSPNIAAAELNAMRAEIANQVNADEGYIRKFPYQHPGACVIASTPLLIDTWDAASEMTLDGNAVAAAANIGAFIDNINAVDGYFAVEDPNTAGQIVVARTDNAATPVFANTAGTIAAAAAVPEYLTLIQRYEDATFEVVTNDSVAGSQTLQDTVFAFLTPDEVQQIFSHIPNDGHLAAERRRPNQVLNVPYVKINIDVGQMHYDLHGASHGNMFITSVELYMPAAEWNTPVDRWAAVAANRFLDPGADDAVTDVFTWWG